VTLMPSADAPAISFSQEELVRLRKLRRTFLRTHGVPSHEQYNYEEQKGTP
jgi:hypothetical protein